MLFLNEEHTIVTVRKPWNCSGLKSGILYTRARKGPIMLQKNVLEYLERSASRFPDKTAFTDESGPLTFGALLARARSMGTALARLSRRHNAPVAVLTERTADTLAAFMGVLCAGNYYVPIDNAMPMARMKAILTTLSPAALVYPAGQAETARELARFCPVLSEEEGFACPEDSILLTQRRAQVLDVDPVYVIFTSGSTGTPKGIVICHRSVIDFVEWLAEAGEFTEHDVMGNQAPFYFDLSVKDVYLTLKCGATTHIIPKKCFSFPLLLMQFLEEKQVTALIWATSAFHLAANSGALEKAAPTHLRTVILGGEALQAKQLNRWRAVLPEVRYINLYGPTEVTVDCTCYPIDREFADTEMVPIGRACANKEVFLLDEQLRPVPPGQPGEICVRGMGLARGYFGAWDKTRSAFIQDPRNPDYPDLIYRTGDLAVMDDSGLLTFLTRRDGQIKHMGYRIELGEIEAALSGLGAIDEVACLFDRQRDRILCVYTGSEDGNEIAKAARAVLPRYMIPNLYHRLETMPRNMNGKIDRPRLAEEFIKGTH